jgi:hypothetical protein
MNEPLSSEKRALVDLGQSVCLIQFGYISRENMVIVKADPMFETREIPGVVKTPVAGASQ